jgi:hypothetical protein
MRQQRDRIHQRVMFFGSVQASRTTGSPVIIARKAHGNDRAGLAHELHKTGYRRIELKARCFYGGWMEAPVGAADRAIGLPNSPRHLPAPTPFVALSILARKGMVAVLLQKLLSS